MHYYGKVITNEELKRKDFLICKYGVFFKEFSEFLSAQRWEANGQPIRMTVRFHCVERFLQRYARNGIYFFLYFRF